MEYSVEIMLREFDGSFEKSIAYCQRQVWMAEINGNNRMLEEYSKLKAALDEEQTLRVEKMMNQQRQMIGAAFERKP